MVFMVSAESSGLAKLDQQYSFFPQAQYIFLSHVYFLVQLRERNECSRPPPKISLSSASA